MEGFDKLTNYAYNSLTGQKIKSNEACLFNVKLR